MVPEISHICARERRSETIADAGDFGDVLRPMPVVGNVRGAPVAVDLV